MKLADTARSWLISRSMPAMNSLVWLFVRSGSVMLGDVPTPGLLGSTLRALV
jgi:hypothetical protein